MDYSARLIRVVLPLSALLGLVGLMLLWLPLQWFLPLVQPYTADGSVETSARYMSDVVGLYPVLYLSITLILISGGSWWLWGRVPDQPCAIVRRNSAEITTRVMGAVAGESRLHVAGVILVLVVATVLRVSAIDMSMRYDESTTFMEYAQMPLVVGITTYTAPNNHIFHTLFAHLSIGLFGEHPYAIRLPALLAGIGVVLGTYFYARLLANRHVALLAMALAATNFYLLHFSVYARGYTMQVLFFLLLSILVFRVDAGTWLDRGRKAGIVVYSLAGLYTVPTALYGVLANFLHLLWIAARGAGAGLLKRILTLILLGVLVAGACAYLYLAVFMHTPYDEWLRIPMFSGKMGTETGHALLAVNMETFGSVLDTAVAVFPYGVAGVFMWLLLLGLIGGMAGFSTLRLHAGALLLAIVGMLIVHPVTPFARVWTFLMPLVCCLMAIPVAWGLYRLVTERAREFAHLTTAILILAFTASPALDMLKERHYLPDGDGIVRYLKNQFDDGDRLVALNHTVTPLGYYLYYLDVFGVREYQSYPMAALVDHFRGRQTHPDLGLHEAAMHRYVYWLPRHAEKLEDARRIFFVVDEKRDIKSDVLGANPSGFTEPELLKSFERARLYVSTRE